MNNIKNRNVNRYRGPIHMPDRIRRRRIPRMNEAAVGYGDRFDDLINGIEEAGRRFGGNTKRGRFHIFVKSCTYPILKNLVAFANDDTAEVEIIDIVDRLCGSKSETAERVPDINVNGIMYWDDPYCDDNTVLPLFYDRMDHADNAAKIISAVYDCVVCVLDENLVSKKQNYGYSEPVDGIIQIWYRGFALVDPDYEVLKDVAETLDIRRRKGLTPMR